MAAPRRRRAGPCAETLARRRGRLDGWRAPLYIGWSPLPALDTIDAYWLVVPLSAGSADLPTPPPRCFDPDAERIRLSAFELIRVRCPAAAAMTTIGTDG